MKAKDSKKDIEANVSCLIFVSDILIIHELHVKLPMWVNFHFAQNINNSDVFFYFSLYLSFSRTCFEAEEI